MNPEYAIVGAKVKIIPGTRYDSGTSHNPSNIEGVIIEIDQDDPEHYIRVEWPNGNNSYSHTDLQLASLPDNHPIFN